MTKPDEPNPNATIQLGAANADDVQLIDGEAAEDAPESADAPASAAEGAAAKPRSAPPPLPPEASLPPPASPASVAPPTPSAAPGPAPAKRHPVVYGVAFVVLLGVAITVGIKVGHLVRGQPEPVASAGPPATPSASATAAKPATIVMPTIEMMDEPPDAH